MQLLLWQHKKCGVLALSFLFFKMLLHRDGVLFYKKFDKTLIMCECRKNCGDGVLISHFIQSLFATVCSIRVFYLKCYSYVFNATTLYF